jgi:hypothetical protein
METMRKTLGKHVLRTSAFALACLALAGADVKAAALHTYSTTGTVTAIDPSSGMSTITGTPDITFVPVQSGTFNAPSAAGLGYFQVSQTAANTETDYNNTPFTITYNPLAINGAALNSAPISISGTLTGSITTDANGNQSSSVVATFNPIISPTFSTPNGTFLSTLSVTNSPLNLVPYSAGGDTTVQAQVITSGPKAAPEPTTLAILATSLVGLGLRQKLRSNRKSA